MPEPDMDNSDTSDDPKAFQVAPEIRESIGKLMIIMMATTDPGMKLQITAAVISVLKGTLKVLLDKRAPMAIDELFGEILHTMIDATRDQSDIYAALKPLHATIIQVYTGKTQGKIRGDLEITRDLERLKNCSINWKYANMTYIQEQSAWAQSASMLADIHPILWEIAVRHKLIVVPKFEPFDFAGFAVERGGIPPPPGDQMKPPTTEEGPPIAWQGY